VSLRPGTVFLTDCPARLAIEIIATKWTVVTIFALSKGPLRHGELVELRVEYSLTELGRSLEEPIAMLTEWARTNGEAVAGFQESRIDAADARRRSPTRAGRTSR
jgi:DNA-binding HxlR family transcriptional regulator